MEANLADLEDKRGVFEKMFGFGPRESVRIDDFRAINVVFQRLGISIPEDIVKHFEKVKYLTADQVEVLTKLVKDRINEIEKFGPLGSFKLEEIVDESMRRLEKEDVVNLQSINKTFREFKSKTHRVVLTLDEIVDPHNEKVQFALSKNMKISVTISEDESEKIQRLNAILENPIPDYDKIVNNIEVCNFDYITKNNFNSAQNFLNLLGKKCPNLTTLNFKSITSPNDSPLQLSPEMKNLAHLSLNNVYFVSIKVPSEIKNLMTIHIRGMSNSEIIFPDQLNKLVSLSIGGILWDTDLKFGEMPNLTDLSCESIEKSAKVLLPTALPNLINLNFRECEKNKALQENLVALEAKLSQSQV